MAPRGGGDVVGHLHGLDVVLLDEELDAAGLVGLARLAFLGAQDVAHDLAAGVGAAARAGEVQSSPIAEENALRRGRGRGLALGVAAVALVLIGVVDAVQVHPAGVPPVALLPVDAFPVARVGVGAFRQDQGLKLAAGLQLVCGRPAGSGRRGRSRRPCPRSGRRRRCAGSMQTASWRNTAHALDRGQVGDAAQPGRDLEHQPWSFLASWPAPWVVSSQLSHDPQGDSAGAISWRCRSG